MSDQPSRNLSPRSGGVLHELIIRIKLILRLLGDRRVSPLIKLLPLASLVYLLAPDLAPGPVDDAAAIWLGSVLFVELCPPEVVREHMEALSGVVEGSFREVEEPPGENPGPET